MMAQRGLKPPTARAATVKPHAAQAHIRGNPPTARAAKRLLVHEQAADRECPLYKMQSLHTPGHNRKL